MEIVKPRFTVYNTFSNLQGNLKNILDASPIKFDLINASGFIGLQTFLNEDENYCEIKVSWTDHDSYLTWRQLASTNYLYNRNLLEEYYLQNSISFRRYTSFDSDFQSSCADHPSLLTQISVTQEEKKFFIENVLPLGEAIEFSENEKFKRPAQINSARFLKERTSNIIRNNPTQLDLLRKTLPDFLLAYSFENAMDCALYKCPALWVKMRKLALDTEYYVEKLIQSCTNSAVIVGHHSMGPGLVKHVHRLDCNLRPSLTIGLRLSYEIQSSAVFRTYKPLSADDPHLAEYYVNMAELHKKNEESVHKDFLLDTKVSAILFDGSTLPHSTLWTDDIYIFFVYDGVEFQSGMKDLFISQARLKSNYIESKSGYFYMVN